MIDSRSEPTIANCIRTFPDHTVQLSEAQKRGVRHVSATGTTVENQGQVDVTHRDPNIGDFHFTVQHADVHCPIVPADYFVGLKCKVLFSETGGIIKYPDGRRLRFACHGGVSFMLLNVVDPNEKQPVFSRQAVAKGAGQLLSMRSP